MVLGDGEKEVKVRLTQTPATQRHSQAASERELDYLVKKRHTAPRAFAAADIFAGAGRAL
jgi:hypothetical protein